MPQTALVLEEPYQALPTRMQGNPGGEILKNLRETLQEVLSAERCAFSAPLIPENISRWEAAKAARKAAIIAAARANVNFFALGENFPGAYLSRPQ